MLILGLVLRMGKAFGPNSVGSVSCTLYNKNEGLICNMKYFLFQVASQLKFSYFQTNDKDRLFDDFYPFMSRGALVPTVPHRPIPYDIKITLHKNYPGRHLMSKLNHL